MPDPSARRWITVAAAADYLQVSVHGVRKMIDRGTIPAVHVGRAVRVDLKELERRLEGQLRELNQL